MANLSRVNGHIELFGPVKSIQAFLDFKELMENWYYDITLSITPEQIDEIKEQIENNPNDTYEMSVNFSATGRWVFVDNLENLMKNIASERKTEKDLPSDWTVGYERAYLQLSEEPISITFEYYEIETGIEILNNDRYQIELVKDQFEEPNFYEIFHDNYELNAENVHKLNEYEDVFDHSSYSVKFIDEHYANPDFDWVEYINEYIDEPVDTTDIGEYTTERHQKFIQTLSSEIDNLRLNVNKYNVIWTDITHWFEDEDIQKIITSTLRGL